ncbi:MAG: DUF992 domain-containing protein [Hyphomicrobiaceae bacterium]|nr:DUF992 domain-containing protein [Hyphomicrobiaceae bacterium]
MRILTSFSTCLALGLLLGQPAYAQGTIEIGTLTCVGGEGVGLVVGSKKTYQCRFAPNGGGRPEGYEATVTKIGLDVGATGKSTMIWTVLAASQARRAGALAGTYAGAAADVAVGVGGGAKLLVGGSNNSITLQPLSVQGQTGLNLAVGVAGMTLRRK